MTTTPDEELLEAGVRFEPILQRRADARLAPLRLFDPFTLVYLFFVLGPFVGGLGALYNSLLLRRASTFFQTLLLSILGAASFVVLFALARSIGVSTGAAFITTRIAHFVFGGLVAFIQRRDLAGHEHLDGPVFPLLPTYLAGFAITLLAPWRFMLLLWGVPLGD